MNLEKGYSQHPLLLIQDYYQDKERGINNEDGKRTETLRIPDKGKILIIDDDNQLTELLEEFLSSYKYDIIIKDKPEEGLKHLEKKEPMVSRMKCFRTRRVKKFLNPKEME